MAVEVVLPGEEIPQSLLPTLQEWGQAAQTGARLAGTLNVDNKKNGIWVEYNSGRYIPHTNDLVLAQVHHSSTDAYHCALTPHTPFATLPHLAFENATKKTRPILAPGALVYARVAAASKHMDPELECLSATTGKADGLGPAQGRHGKDAAEEGGPGRVVVLEALAERVRFEVAVGRNGRVWVDSDEGVEVVLAAGKALQGADREGLGVDGQRDVVAKVLKAL
ncbi:uncharacterized protein IWZ02DRAFT_502667 [Phyllosticta citriasiana]|uniref:uncharacterized protein n=1 Tax=Phyllosticta citriasiana TaxID=595635 RepID=UPI0030FD7E42